MNRLSDIDAFSLLGLLILLFLLIAPLILDKNYAREYPDADAHKSITKQDQKKTLSYAITIFETYTRGQDAQTKKQNCREGFSLAISGFGLLVVVAYTSLTYGLWHAAKDANVINERPWVYAEVALISGITYDQNGMNLSFHFGFKNTGHSPAIFTLPIIEAHARPRGGNISTEQRAACEPERRLPRERSVEGFTIFPEQSIEQNIDTSVPWEELRKSNLSGDVLIDVVGCVDYQFPVFDRHHETGFAFSISQINPGEPGPHYSINFNNGPISHDRVIMDALIFEGAGFYAD